MDHGLHGAGSSQRHDGEDEGYYDAGNGLRGGQWHRSVLAWIEEHPAQRDTSKYMDPRRAHHGVPFRWDA